MIKSALKFSTTSLLTYVQCSLVFVMMLIYKKKKKMVKPYLNSLNDIHRIWFSGFKINRAEKKKKNTSMQHFKMKHFFTLVHHLISWPLNILMHRSLWLKHDTILKSSMSLKTETSHSSPWFTQNTQGNKQNQKKTVVKYHFFPNTSTNILLLQKSDH